MNWKECVGLIKADKSRFMGSIVRIYFSNESFLDWLLFFGRERKQYGSLCMY